MKNKGNFKVRVIENIGERSEDVFGSVGSVLVVEDGILFAPQNSRWTNDGEGYCNAYDLNHQLSYENEWQTVFELVEEPEKKPKVFEKGVKYRFSKKKYCKWHLKERGYEYQNDKSWVDILEQFGEFTGDGTGDIRLGLYFVEPQWCKRVKEKDMSINDYQKKSMRTLNTEGKSQEQLITGLLLGIHGESGEISDIFKKHYNQGHELDINHVIEEIGDTMFYIANLCNVLGIDMSDVLEKNVTKLLERYPNGFEEERSTNRYDRLD